MLPATRRIRLLAIMAVALAVLAAGALSNGAQNAASAPLTVTWAKDPASITAVLTDPLQTFTFNEIMSNQSDPAGLGGFAFTVVFDRNLWQAPSIDTTPASTLFTASGRTLSCMPGRLSPSTTETVCASTGAFGVGPVWSGSMVLATVRLQLIPAVAAAIIGTNGGLSTSVYDISVQVTNTCGQPLNDGTVTPLPGQHECQGNLLPGVGPGGVIPNPGDTVITLTTPATPTPTATASPTSTFTPTATATATATATPTPTATATARPSRTATATQTAGTVTAGGTPTLGPGTPTVGATSIATGTPGAGTSPTAAATGAATRTTTAVPTATSTPQACARDDAFWRTHPDRWPVTTLRLGTATYTRDDMGAILASSSPDDASVIVAKQLIASKLNMAAGGADQLAPIAAQADRLLREAGARVPMGVDLQGYLGVGMVWTAAWLSEANCMVVASSAAPTEVSTVLGSTRARPGPHALPSTGSDSAIGGALSYRSLIVAFGLVIAVLAVAMVRLVLLDDVAKD